MRRYRDDRRCVAGADSDDYAIAQASGFAFGPGVIATGMVMLSPRLTESLRIHRNGGALVDVVPVEGKLGRRPVLGENRWPGEQPDQQACHRQCECPENHVNRYGLIGFTSFARRGFRGEGGSGTSLRPTPGRALTYEHPGRRVWGRKGDDDVRPMRIVVSGLRRKLGDNVDNPTYAFTQPRLGYRMLKGETKVWRG